MKNKLLSAALAAVITLSCCTASVASFSAAQTDDTAGSSQYAQDSIRGAAVLHCFNWSYNEIKKNLPQIAEAGYTAVQTSPVQQPKDYKSSYTEMSGQWWKLYQPLTLSIADGGTSWLGTKAELKAMCDEADNYNIKVIVDIVSNHMANKQEGGGYKNLSPDVESNMKNADYYHTETYAASDSARYSMTHGHIGMPDLNTANSHVQQRVLGLLEECVDCGVDGFRFDAAKHIELPSDNDKTKSDFWSVIINGIKKKKSDVFCYGEILNSAATDITNYTEYIAITDNRTGNYALSMAKSKNAKSLSKNTYMMGAAAADSVLWAESHDTYMNEGTDAIDNSIIYKAWAITGARAESTSLYLARPNSKMGLASTDDGWKSKTVSEINKFKNYFMGEGESLSYSGKTAYIERGTKGVSISKLDGEGSVSLEAKSMDDGTYKDQITGNTFTVKDGIISGEVGSTCVAVVYNPESEKPTVTVTIGDADLDGEITVNDVTMVQKYIAELEKPEYIKVTGDTNGDGTVDINDASTIQMYLAEMPVESLVGKTVKVEK